VTAMPGAEVITTGVQKVLANLGAVNFRGRKVIVTGGAGFLGSWMCDILIAHGAEVLCLDNLSSGRRENIANLISRPGFTFVEHDVSLPMTMVRHVDYVFHLASRASPLEFTGHPIEIIRANTIGTMNALDIARDHQARFLFTSTSEAYGEPAVVPTPETYRGNVSSTGIRGCYDESKRCGEATVMAYHRQYGLDVHIARIFNTYGPRMRADGIYGRVAPRFIQQALAGNPLTVFGKGEQTRSFTYVTDQVEGLLKLAASSAASGKVVNIGNNSEVKVIDLARVVKELIDSTSTIVFEPLPPDDPTRRCPDIGLAHSLLGWMPRTGLEEGLRNTTTWFRQANQN